MLVVATELQKDILMCKMIDSWRGVTIFSVPRNSKMYAYGLKYRIVMTEKKLWYNFRTIDEARKYIDYLVDNWKPVKRAD